MADDDDDPVFDTTADLRQAVLTWQHASLSTEPTILVSRSVLKILDSDLSRLRQQQPLTTLRWRHWRWQ